MRTNLEYSIDDSINKPKIKPVGTGTWLIQRLSKPVGFKNPFGDVSVQVENDDDYSVSIEDVISPDYMGAAEYEWGIFPKCIKMMQDMGTHPNGVWRHEIHHKSVYVVSSNESGGRNFDEIRDIIDYLYFAPSLELHNTGRLPEISKSDHSSFYRAMSRCLVNDYKNVKTHGWLNVKRYFAWFIDKEMAFAFDSYCNSIMIEA